MKTAASIMLIAIMLTSVVPPLYADAQTSSPPAPSDGVSYNIVGVGASFPFPLIDLWRVKITDAYSNFNVNYNSIGSGGGVKQHISELVAFAATDAPLTAREVEAVQPTLHIPEAVGAVNIVYNAEGIPDGLKLKGQVAADIFEGRITEWDDPAIAADNPGIDLPSEDITVVHRSDGSGTTKVFTQWMSEVSPSWYENVGSGKSVGWPVGVGSPGNEGVAGILLSTEGSIGYVSIAYTIQNDIKSVAVENGDQTGFVYPSLESTADAAGELAKAQLPEAQGVWSDVDLLNAPGEGSYPIATFTYLLVYEDVAGVTDSLDEARGLVWMLDWMITEGQQYSAGLGFVPLPDEVVELGKRGLGSVTYDGTTVWEYVPAAEEPEEEPKLIPAWIKQIFQFYVDGIISDKELIGALQYLISQGVIPVS